MRSSSSSSRPPSSQPTCGRFCAWRQSDSYLHGTARVTSVARKPPPVGPEIAEIRNRRLAVWPSHCHKRLVSGGQRHSYSKLSAHMRICARVHMPYAVLCMFTCTHVCMRTCAHADSCTRVCVHSACCRNLISSLGARARAHALVTRSRCHDFADDDCRS